MIQEKVNEAAEISVSPDGYAIAAFLGYLLIIIGIGIYTTRFSSKGISEYFIAGRKMNRFVVALSAVVSARSAWLLLSVTGMAYTIGHQLFGQFSAILLLSCSFFSTMLNGSETLLKFVTA